MERQDLRSQHSCKKPLQFVLTKWICELDRNNTVIAVFRTQRKSFETIDN